MSAPHEVFGLADTDGSIKILLSEGTNTIAVQMGHLVQRIGPKSARILATRLNNLAGRIEKRPPSTATSAPAPRAKK